MARDVIPKDFVDEYLKKAKGSTFFGVPIENLSRDELIACLAVAGEEITSKREQSSRERDFMLSLGVVKRRTVEAWIKDVLVIEG